MVNEGDTRAYKIRFPSSTVVCSPARVSSIGKAVTAKEVITRTVKGSHQHWDGVVDGRRSQHGDGDNRHDGDTRQCFVVKGREHYADRGIYSSRRAQPTRASRAVVSADKTKATVSGQRYSAITVNGVAAGKVNIRLYPVMVSLLEFTYHRHRQLIGESAMFLKTESFEYNGVFDDRHAF